MFKDNVLLRKSGRLRVLHITGGPLDNGGITNFLLNYFRFINKSEFQFDFLVQGESLNAILQEVIDQGGNVISIPYKSTSITSHITLTYSAIKHGDYDIVHCHQDAMNIIPILMAKLCKVDVVISHSHNTAHCKTGLVRSILHDFVLRFSRLFSFHKFACSSEAARWLFGKNLIEKKDFHIIYNAVNIDSFLFNKRLREKVRESLQLNKCFVIGMIGRLDAQKNHKFMIELAVLLSQVNLEGKQIKFVIIGSGPDEDYLKDVAVQRGLSNITWLGNCNNVTELINSFDLFIMPSLFEGLGISCIEAQINGLPCLVSSNVPQSVKKSNGVEFINLIPGLWHERILYNLNNVNRNEFDIDIADYRIENATKRLEIIYKNLVLNE